MELMTESRDKIISSLNMINTMVTQFTKEEYGNKLSQFSLQALTALIKKETDQIVSILNGDSNETNKNNTDSTIGAKVQSDANT